MNFDEKFFQKIKFDQAAFDDFLLNAQDDLDIARESKIAKVKFKFAYDALIKIGITLIASKGYKVRSKTGHHFQILEKMARILKDPDEIVEQSSSTLLFEPVENYQMTNFSTR